MKASTPLIGGYSIEEIVYNDDKSMDDLPSQLKCKCLPLLDFHHLRHFNKLN